MARQVAFSDLVSVETFHPEVRTLDVDGIPAFWLPVPGPFLASLMFRVGRADETLATGGICHLVEHLALHPIGARRHPAEFNGFVDATMTVFHAHGEPADVADFLTLLCLSLRDLQLDRLETERGVLRSESSNYAVSGPLGSLLRWRYGPRTYGLVAYDEFGLEALAPDDVAGWAASRFTRGNAALWLTGQPPASLRLDLPDGEAIATPEPSSALPVRPAWYAEGTDSCGWLTTVPRRASATALRHAVQERLLARLRYESGSSYNPFVGYLPRDRFTSTLWALADCVEGHEEAVAVALYDVLNDVAEGHVSPEDLESWRRVTLGRLAEPDALRGLLHNLAWDRLHGAEPRTAEHLRAEIQAVTPDDVSGAAEPAAALALHRVAERAGRPGRPLAAAPAWSDRAVTGETFTAVRRRPGDPGPLLVVGRAGLMLRVSQEQKVSVPYGECDAMLVWKDGRRMLFGSDGFVIDVVPQRWIDGRRAVEELDRRVSSGVHVPMPDLDPQLRPPEPAYGEPWLAWAGCVAILLVAMAVGLGVSVSVSPAVGVAVASVLSVWPVTAVLRARKVRGLRGFGGAAHHRPQ